MIDARRRALLDAARAFLAIAILGLASCSRAEHDTEPRPADVVCRVGPASFTDESINRWLTWLRKRDAALSPAKIRRITITDFLVPRAVAQGFAGKTKIEAARQSAERFYRALVAANGDLESFRKIAKLQGVRLTDDEDFVRPFNTLPLDMTEAAFDVEIGSHSAVLESKLGFAVVAAVDRTFDVMERRRLLVAAFPYDTDVKFGAAVQKASIELLSEKAWVHPRYRRELESVFRNLSEDWPPETKPKNP